jgi:hypothetical protein
LPERLDDSTINYSSSASGVAEGDDDSLGCCFPCRGPLDSSDGPGDRRGFICGPLRGANFAEGEGRDDGDSSLSSLCRGEINECGVELDLGESDGLGETDGLGDAVTDGSADGCSFGEADGRTVELGDAEGEAVVLLRKLQLNAELLASAVSMLATVRTSPPLKLPRVLFAGNVAVGGWPTGIGS